MQLSVRQGDQTHIVDIPAQLASGIPFVARIGARTVTATWNDQLGLLTVNVDGKEYNLKARNFTRERFADESETSVRFEWYDSIGKVMRATEASIDHHVPGAANRRAAAANAGKQIRSPMTGKVISVAVTNGTKVAKGETIMVIEAMKMENKIAATAAGIIHGLQVVPGQSVAVGADLCGIRPEA